MNLMDRSLPQEMQFMKFKEKIWKNKFYFCDGCDGLGLIDTGVISLSCKHCKGTGVLGAEINNFVNG